MLAHLGHQPLSEVDAWTLEKFIVEAQEIERFVHWYRTPDDALTGE